MERLQQQVVALAGAAQAAVLVHQLALHGIVAQDRFSTAVQSLFVLDPNSTLDVFGSLRQLRPGLETLKELLGSYESVLAPAEGPRYFSGILHLEGQLKSRDKMLERIRLELQRLQTRYPLATVADEPVALRELAALYRSTLSTLPFRIHVRGDLNYLRNEHVADKVRVLLFAGVRAAFLWRQLGGRRWQLLFKRGALAREADALLKQL
ncbi:MAG TPA: high frequency lysogenization protein HflD [Candidatus Acidoferrum sp.]|nr:high frequency lysogenization protein HflD [Candidatus Acidoferrum sp.]